MKSLTYYKYRNTADYWSFTDSDNSGGRDYAFDRFIVCNVGTEGGVTRITVMCDEPLDKFGWIKNIRDRAGNLVFLDEESTLVINSVEPRMNLLGYREGYRMRCSGGS